MSFIVTIRFKGDPKAAHRVLRENPHLDAAVRQGIHDHGVLRCARLVGDGEFLDIDEWPSEAERDAFVAAAQPQIAEWVKLAEITPEETKLWREAAEDEVF